MAFEAKKYGDIFEAMRASSAATGVVTDFEVGSVTRTLSESFAYEMALLYEKMRLVYLSAYVDTAEGQQLDMVVAVLGILRGEPDFAQGVVTFQRDVSKDDTQVPAGTLVATEDKPGAPKIVFQTVEPVTLAKGLTTVDARVQASIRGETQTAAAGAVVVMPRPIPGIKSVANATAITFTGKKSETDSQLRDRAKNALVSSGKATLVSIENALLSLPNVSDVRVIEYFDQSKFGLIDVFVDGVDLTDSAVRANLTAVIDGVRAAGIFARLQQTTPLNIEATFQIQISPDLKLAPAERADLENKVAANVVTYIKGLKMGQSLLMSQVIKSILAIEGVTDLVKYAVTQNGTPVLQDSARSLDSKASERFQPALICAASEIKSLPIDLQFKATAGLTTASLATLTTSLSSFLSSLAPGTTVAGTDLLKRVTDAGVTPDMTTLVITPHSWCGSAQVKVHDVIPKFVEQPALGSVFFYSGLLQITGALRLTLSPQLTGVQQSAIEAEVRQAIANLLAGLTSGQGVVFADLIKTATSVAQVQDAQVNSNDFRVRMANAPADLPGRVSATKIDVQPFERPALQFFTVTGSIRVVSVSVSQLAVSLVVAGKTPTAQPLADQQAVIIKSLAGRTLLSAQAPAQNISYDNLKAAIENLAPGVSMTVTGMTISATSQADNRTQTISTPGSVILIRSVEVANVMPLDAAKIVVTVSGSQTS